MGLDVQLDSGERHVAQSFLTDGVLFQDELEELLSLVEKEFMYSKSLDQLLQNINEAFSFLDFEAKKGYILKDKEYVPAWFLINRNGDEIARDSQPFNQSEISAIQELIKLIFEATDRTVSPVEFLNSVTSLSKKAADALLDDLCKSYWLEKLPGLLFELDEYLNKEFQEVITNCFICGDIVAHGNTCRSCPSMAHSFCFSRISERLGKSEKVKCSNC